MDGMTDKAMRDAAKLAEARDRFKETLGKAEGGSMLMVLGAVCYAPKNTDEEQLKLKMETALDTFEQGFQLLRDLVDGK